MKHGTLLSAFWTVLVILFLPRAVRSDPPDCGDCFCAEAEAWILVDGDTKTGPYVLKDKDGKVFKWGFVQETQGGKVSQGVEAPTCLKNNVLSEDPASHKAYIFEDVTWEATCKAKGTNLKYMLATKYNNNWTTTAEGISTKLKTCGPQDPPPE